MATQPERIVLTYEDLLQLPEDRNRYELFEGELEVTAAPVPRHQVVVGNLLYLLHGYVRQNDLGLVLVALVDVRLSDITVVEPDLVYIAKGREAIVGDRFIGGPPDLVIEVLSPSTAARDRHAKRQLYARHGVINYWTFDPDGRVIEAFTLVGDAYRVGSRSSDQNRSRPRRSRN